MTQWQPRVVIITCNWNAYESLDAAGKQHLAFPTGARPLKVDCLGQVGSSLILKAFEKGADGVMLLGCAEKQCHYEFGSRRAAELFEEVRKLVGLLGFREEQLDFYQVRAGESAAVIERVRTFVDRLVADRPQATQNT